MRIHRLVQEITRERLPEDRRDAWLGAALAVVDAYLPADPPPQDVRAWPRWEPLRPHVAALVATADAAGIPKPTTRLMSGLGLFLKTKCVWAEAEPLYRHALSIDEASFGPEHPEVASDLSNLAGLLQTTNRLPEAEPLMRRAMEILKRFTAETGHPHPHLRQFTENYEGLLAQLGQHPTGLLARAGALLRWLGILPGR